MLGAIALGATSARLEGADNEERDTVRSRIRTIAQVVNRNEESLPVNRRDFAPIAVGGELRDIEVIHRRQDAIALENGGIFVGVQMRWPSKALSFQHGYGVVWSSVPSER
jgi:hypothetical protein